MLPTTQCSLQDLKLTSADEALEVLLTRTSRLTRILPARGGFRLRLRSLGFRGIHISRTWEPRASFEIDGRPVPVIFFPVGESTTIRTVKGERVCSPRYVGSFTIAEPAFFEPVQGYSEVVLKFDDRLLARYLSLLDIGDPLDEVLSRAALRHDLPCMAQLRRNALELLDEGDGQIPEPLRARFYQTQEEAFVLRAASMLETLYRPVEAGARRHPGLDRAVEFIRLRFQHELLVEEVAGASGVSIRLLQLLFRQHFDCTPGEYIQQLRLDHAHRLLSLRLTPSVTAAALESGFDHLGEFSAAYMKRYGEKPSETLRQSRH